MLEWLATWKWMRILAIAIAMASMVACADRQPPVSPRPTVSEAHRDGFISVDSSKLSRYRKARAPDAHQLIQALLAGEPQPEGEGTPPTLNTFVQQNANVAVLEIVRTNLQDDSIAGEKIRFEAARDPVSGEWSVVWAGTQVQCQTGRGHQTWSSQPCQ